MKRLLAKYSPLVILAGLCLFMAWYSENFRQPANLQSVALRTSEVGIIAMGQLLVILTRGIDLSVGSVAALGGVVGGLAMTEWGLPMPLGLLAGVLAGTLCGLVNGVLVTKGRIPPFIVTLGMMLIARGLTLLLSGGNPVFGLPDSIYWLGGQKAWYVPVAITLAITISIGIMLKMTRFGRSLYAIGGNLQAARLSGIPVDRVRTLAYVLCGSLAGFAGMVLTARSSIAAPMAAEMYELDAIAACVIGGASLMGGEGGALAALAGALIMNVLYNFCNLENLDVYWQKVIVGTLIIVMVFYDGYRKRKAGLLQE